MLVIQVALIKKGKLLVPAGIGYQPSADFNRGDEIDESSVETLDWKGRCWVKIGDKVFGISHDDYRLED